MSTVIDLNGEPVALDFINRRPARPARQPRSRSTVGAKAAILAPQLTPFPVRYRGKHYDAWQCPASDGGAPYVVNANPPYCSCAHFARTNGADTCSHIAAARLRAAAAKRVEPAEAPPDDIAEWQRAMGATEQFDHQTGRWVKLAPAVEQDIEALFGPE